MNGYAASDGAAYELFLGRWTRRLAPEFLKAVRAPGDGAILDIGCGSGSCTFAAAEMFPGQPVFGIDVAEPYVAFARQRATAPWPRFEVGNALAIGHADSTFSAAVAELVLNFVSDADRAASEMRRVVRRSGVAGARVWDFRGGLVYQRMFWDTAAGIDLEAARIRDRLFSHPLALPDGLVDLWRRAGFVDVERQSVTVRMDFANFADYWDPLFGGQGPVGTYAASLELEPRRKVETAVRLAFLSGAADGPRSLTATAWTVRGIVP